MTEQDWISLLSITALVLSIFALIYLIIVLYRANRVVARFERLTNSFHGFVSEIVPAIVSMGTITAAIHSILRTMVSKSDPATKTEKIIETLTEHRPKTSKKS